MKKTIIALAAASSVALSHGVAVAEGNQEQTKIFSEAGALGSLSQGKEESTPDPEGNENEGKDTGTGSGQNQEKTEATGSSKIFGWEDDASPVDKLIKIGAAVAAVVSLLGSISALFANIEKLVNQFTK